jgi:hypothetical protein
MEKQRTKNELPKFLTAFTPVLKNEQSTTTVTLSCYSAIILFLHNTNKTLHLYASRQQISFSYSYALAQEQQEFLQLLLQIMNEVH